MGINKMKQTILIAAEKMVNPPMIVPDDGVTNYKFSTRAGSMNYWRANGLGGAKPEQVMINHNLPVGLEMLQDERNIINNAFFLDLFNMLAQQTEAMTATEVMQRVEEKLNQFAPTWANLQSEVLGPVIQRVFGILIRNRMLPPPPAELIESNDASYEVNYISKIALASEMIKAKAYFSYVEAVSPLMQVNPEAAAAFTDTVNLPKVYRELAYGIGMPVEWTYSQEEADQRAADRAQQQQQAQAVEQAEKMAGAAGKLPPEMLEQAASQAQSAQAGKAAA